MYVIFSIILFQDFTQKTDLLLKYVEQNYLGGMMDEDSAKLLNKLKAKSNQGPEDKKVMEYGFDAIFSTEKKE